MCVFWPVNIQFIFFYYISIILTYNFFVCFYKRLKDCCRYQRNLSAWNFDFMLGLDSVVDLVKRDFYTKKNINPCYDFFYSSALTYLISLEIASATLHKQCMSYELLCKKIPPKLGCRSTIYSTLNFAVDKGFFIKKFIKKDKRVKSYCLSENYSLMLTEWYLDQKKYFSN